MSFASQEGSSIGQSISIPFDGNDNNIVSNTIPIIALETVIPRGTFIFTTSINMYSLPFSSHYTLGAKIAVVYQENTLAQMRLNDQENDVLCITGILFSDGESPVSVLVEAFNNSDETTQLWGYSNSVLQLVRLNNI